MVADGAPAAGALTSRCMSSFWHYITNVLRGDFGHFHGLAASRSSEIASRFMPTLWLTLASMSWAYCSGWRRGLRPRLWRNRWPDRLGMALAVSAFRFRLLPLVCC
ncbi:dipeptide transport system permease DppB [Klebsiella pneumoniae]|uniref:Dipeptide transport system permease DppB n=1 Tax=Klebsiella pneumoniae TaxID=573 RepID=A0A4P0Y133_KLEPN|nr:dipeptide transport system permease DppB [Klebsiella pneumoniae]